MAKKAKKKKIITPEEAHKKEMILKIIELKNTLEEEKKILTQFQSEKEKYQKNWLIAKEKLSDKRFDILQKEKEIQEIQKNNNTLIQQQREKVKQFLYEK